MTHNTAPSSPIPGSPGVIGAEGPAGSTTDPDPQDFWRGDAGTTFPDGTADTTQGITRQGNVGVGDIAAAEPVAKVDIASGTRSGSDVRAPDAALYVTGELPGIAAAHTGDTADNLVAFAHRNQTQGVGIAYNGLFAAGSNPNHDLAFSQKGTGAYKWWWQGIVLAAQRFYNKTVRGVGAGHVQSYYMNGDSDIVGQWYPAYGEDANNYRMQWDTMANGALTAALRLQPDMSDLGNTTLDVGENRAHNRKIVLYDSDPTSQTSFFGFGINSGTLRYQVGVDTNYHRFYGATTEIMNMRANVGMELKVATAGQATDEYMVRNPADGRLRIRTRAQVITDIFSNLPVYQNNNAATTGGLAVGQPYRNNGGNVRVVV